MTIKKRLGYTVIFKEDEYKRLDELSIKLNTSKSKILLSGLYLSEDALKDAISRLESEREDERGKNATGRKKLSDEEKQLLKLFREKNLSIEDLK